MGGMLLDLVTSLGGQPSLDRQGPSFQSHCPSGSVSVRGSVLSWPSGRLRLGSRQGALRACGPAVGALLVASSRSESWELGLEAGHGAFPHWGSGLLVDPRGSSGAPRGFPARIAFVEATTQVCIC